MSLLKTLTNCHPSLTRGQVWCKKCGQTQKINTAHCLRCGFPECCGETMTIDSPEEQKNLRRNDERKSKRV
jgi:Zn finger protein HypA/HybF involved in hydrogenase expression